MTTDMTRRQMLGRTSALGAGIVLAGSIDAIAGPGSALAATTSAVGYGALVPDPAGLLSLPPGFQYKIVARAGQSTLEDVVGGAAAVTPSDADGTAHFPGSAARPWSTTTRSAATSRTACPPCPGLTYDPGRARGHHHHRGRRSTATGSASTSASPAPTTTAPAASRRGTPG